MSGSAATVRSKPSVYILPVAECWVRYKAPAFYDDMLSIETTIAELTRFTCTFNYRVTRQDVGRSRPTLLAKGYTVHAAVTREGKLTRLPAEIMERLRTFAP